MFSRLGQIGAERGACRHMKITPALFQAYLKCPMKCWLRATGEAATGNTYAEWMKSHDESYRTNETARLPGELSNGELAASPEAENLKSARWLLATNVTVQAMVNYCAVESNIAALERIPSQGRGKAAQFVPIRVDEPFTGPGPSPKIRYLPGFLLPRSPSEQ
jgi:hypothetical protein